MTGDAVPGGSAPVDPAFDAALLDTFVRQAPVAFAFYDRNLRYRRINRALAEINGVSLEEHLGRRPSDVLPPALGAAVEAVLRRVLAGGAPVFDDDFTGRSPTTGDMRHWQSSWFPVRAEDGAVVGIAVLVVDVTERRRAERGLRRSRDRALRQHQATVQLVGASTPGDVAGIVAGTALAAVGADSAAVGLLERGRLRWVGPPGSGVERMRWLPSVPTTGDSLVAVVLATGEPLYVDGPADLQGAGSPRLAERLLATTPERAWAVLPLEAPGGRVGVLRVATHTPRPLGAEDRMFLEGLAGQGAIAVERTRLYERERLAAATLQRALLPDRLPSVPGVELAARFRPASGDTEVGGDWYDVFTLPDERVGLVVGDVMGKGLEAAAGMGRLRAALRALAYSDPSPRSVLAGLDRMYTATESDDQIATLVYLVVDPATRSVVGADAGHLPLLVLGADGRAELVEAGAESTPLGWPEPRTERSFRLRPGDVVVGFSDGLVESRRRPLQEGLDALVAAARGVAGAAARAGDIPALETVVEVLLGRLASDDASTDDVTLLAVRLGA